MNERFPIQGIREAVRCSAHVFARSENFWLALFKILRKFIQLLTEIFGPSSRNLSEFWVNTYGQNVRMKTTRGVRWFSLFWNCDIAIRNWDKVMETLNDHRNRGSCKELLELIGKHEETMIPDLVSTALTGRSLGPRGYWPKLTQEQTKREFLDKIKELTSFESEVRNSENILETYSKFFSETENQELAGIYDRVINKNKFVLNHKKNFTSIVNYVIKALKPNTYSNLDSKIGEIGAYYRFKHKFKF